MCVATIYDGTEFKEAIVGSTSDSNFTIENVVCGSVMWVGITGDGAGTLYQAANIVALSGDYQRHHTYRITAPAGGTATAVFAPSV